MVMNSILVDIIIFGQTSERAFKMLDDLLINEYIIQDDIKRIIKSKNIYKIELKNNRRYIAIKATQGCRGYRCHRAIVDWKVDNEIIDCIIKPIATLKDELGNDAKIEISVYSKFIK